MKKAYCLLLMLIPVLGGYSQGVEPQQAPKGGMPVPAGRITGKVIEAASGQAVEYATITLYRAKDSTMADGVITGRTGHFEFLLVRPGNYYIIAQFIGFRKMFISGIAIRPDKLEADLGPIELRTEVTSLGEVEIVGEVPLVEYQLDKKVVNVDQQISAQGGTAVDVLERVPSVQTDLEGNVTLRGSSSFTVLIDGKPSLLEGSDALNQIPAATIDKIEIITNPSAKYDPDGTAGIINVLTKKNALKGISGIMNVSAGTEPSYSGSLQLSYKARKTNVTFGADYADRNMKGYRESYRESYFGDTTSFLQTNSNNLMGRESFSLRAGVDQELSRTNTLTLEGSFRMFGMKRESESRNENWSSIDDVRLNYFTYDIDDGNHPGWQLTFRDVQKFKPENSELSLQVTYNQSPDEADMATRQDLLDDEWTDTLQNILNYRRYEGEMEKEFRGDLDFKYTLPNKGFIEAGFQTRLEHSDIDYQYFDFDTLAGDWILNTDYSSRFDFVHDIQALYATYAHEFKSFSIKGGLRAEYTHRELDETGGEEDYLFEQFDIYPSAYFTYKLPLDQQVQLSYSKRVNRPRPNMLNPYPNFSDAFSSFTGNPELEPEYAHAMELNYQKYFGASYITVESYYRITTNKMTRIQALDDQGVLILTMDNIDDDRSLGIEASADIRIKKWLNINPVVTVYDYKLNSSENGEESSRSSTNWDAGLEVTADLKTSTRLRFTMDYEGPSVTVDGTREGTFFMGFAARQNFLDNNLSLTLNIRDILDSRHMKGTSESVDFYSNNEMWRQAPVFSLTVIYKWNNFNRRRAVTEGMNGEFDMMDMGEY
jgi:outer membrane receptor protein involved in Fe transport